MKQAIRHIHFVVNLQHADELCCAGGTPVTIDPMPRADDASSGHRFAIRLAH